MIAARPEVPEAVVDLIADALLTAERNQTWALACDFKQHARAVIAALAGREG